MSAARTARVKTNVDDYSLYSRPTRSGSGAALMKGSHPERWAESPKARD
jgi:hypothetical protein